MMTSKGDSEKTLKGSQKSTQGRTGAYLMPRQIGPKQSWTVGRGIKVV